MQLLSSIENERTNGGGRLLQLTSYFNKNQPAEK